MSGYPRQVAAEVAKVLTTRIWWVLALVLFGYIAVLAGGLSGLFGAIHSGAINASMGRGQAPPAAQLPALIYSFASSVGYVFPVLLGALAVTGEFRHQTLTPTFLAAPRRGRVLAAKLTTLVGFGAVLGVVALLASVGVGAVVLGALGVDPQFGDSDTWALIGRSVLAMALWAGVGVGLGALVPNQVASIVIVLAFTQFIEPLLRLASTFTDATAGVGRFLPGAASDALVGASFFSIAAPGASVLDWWQGGLVLLGYAVVLTLLGYAVTFRRDVT